MEFWDFDIFLWDILGRSETLKSLSIFGISILWNLHFFCQWPPANNNAFFYYWYQAIHCVSSFNCIWFIDRDWISDSQFIGCFEWSFPWSFFFSFVSVTVFHASILILDLGIYIPNSRWERKKKTFEIWLQIFICILFNVLKYIYQEARYQWMVDYSRWTGIVFEVLPCYFLFFHIESEKYCQLIWWLLHTRTISGYTRK